MKRALTLSFILALATVPSFAAKNSQSVTFPSAVKVGSTQVAAGAYKVSWTGEGSNAQVTLAQGGKVLVTAPAKVVEEKHSYPAVSTSTQSGANVLQSIQLSNVNLVMTDSPVAGQ